MNSGGVIIADRCSPMLSGVRTLLEELFDVVVMDRVFHPYFLYLSRII